MKHISYYILATFCAGALFTACQQEEGIATSESGPKELTLSAESVSDREEVTTRANGNTFFKDGKQIKLLITPNGSAEITKTYTYKTGIFSGSTDDQKFFFQMNDDYFVSKLVALWPEKREESDKPIENGTINENLPTDQRNPDNYQKADWLTAEYNNNSATTEGIMPTDAPVPLHFKRNNARLEFEVQGQHAYGQEISSLILELQLKDLNTSAITAAAFWAYRNEETGHAEVILPSGSKLTTPKANHMIGRIAVAGKTEYTGTVIIPEVLDITLEPNTSYKVTLTPRGDNLIASIEIGGFGQDEEGIGLPFQLPTKISETDVYGINNASQLMTLSYILREYKVGTSTKPEGDFDAKVSAINWKDQKYKLTENITIPAGLTLKQVTTAELPFDNFDTNSYTVKQEGSDIVISFFKQ